jgi:hypothetical protein
MRTTCALVCVLAAACSPAGRDPGAGDDDGAGADASTDPGGDGGPNEQVFVYAHTSSTLYQVNPDTLAIQEIGDFTFTTGSDEITDIAIDKNNLMIGISFGSVYRIDPTTAAATRLSNNLTGEFNGMSFVPAEQLGQTGDDVLVATRNSDGVVFRIDPATGSTTTIGDMGGFSSSGDLVSVAMLGTFQTADNGFGADRLVRLEAGTFAATAIGNEIGFAEIWGVAFWKNKLFGFTNGGHFITIDLTTGGGTLVQGNGPAWWGAAVTTSALVIL